MDDSRGQESHFIWIQTKLRERTKRQLTGNDLSLFKEISFFRESGVLKAKLYSEFALFSRNMFSLIFFKCCTSNISQNRIMTYLLINSCVFLLRSSPSESYSIVFYSNLAQNMSNGPWAKIFIIVWSNQQSISFILYILAIYKNDSSWNFLENFFPTLYNVSNSKQYF